MGLRTIEWKNNAIKIIDQTKLPAKFEYLSIRDVKTLWKAIHQLKVRGAPALGAAAALGLYLGIHDSKAQSFAVLSREIEKTAQYIASSRPTARNLFWALERVCSVAVRHKDKPVSTIKKIVLREGQKIIAEDRVSCRAIGAYGQAVVKKGSRILTICNTGILATIDYGTALGVVYRAHELKKHIKVYACETRPLLQGARLTAWELSRSGIDSILITDSMAATLMRQGKVDLVIAGADRIAANGDTANKIGTYSLAVLAHHHKIPFYIAAPSSTFDVTLARGTQIPIEERHDAEIKELFFKLPMAPKGIKVYNPAFDVTPHALISAIITEKGIIRKPFGRSIKKLGLGDGSIFCQSSLRKNRTVPQP